MRRDKSPFVGGGCKLLFFLVELPRIVDKKKEKVFEESISYFFYFFQQVLRLTLQGMYL
jgi:hypothetical protein